MASDPPSNVLASQARPIALAVDIHEPAPIKLYTVSHDDLSKLETLSEKEQYAFGGSMASIGISASTIVALLTSPPKDPYAFAGLVAVALVLFVVAIVAGAATYFYRRDRKDKSTEIRRQGYMRLSYSLGAPQAPP